MWLPGRCDSPRVGEKRPGCPPPTKESPLGGLVGVKVERPEAETTKKALAVWRVLSKLETLTRWGGRYNAEKARSESPFDTLNSGLVLVDWFVFLGVVGLGFLRQNSSPRLPEFGAFA